VEGGLFFANAEHVRAAVRAHAREEQTKAIVLDGATMPFVDVTASKMLVELRDELEREGVQLALARDVGQVRDVLRRSGRVGITYPTVTEAVEALTKS
jgi:sulfate permease, SulP family